MHRRPRGIIALVCIVVGLVTLGGLVFVTAGDGPEIDPRFYKIGDPVLPKIGAEDFFTVQPDATPESIAAALKPNIVVQDEAGLLRAGLNQARDIDSLLKVLGDIIALNALETHDRRDRFLELSTVEVVADTPEAYLIHFVNSDTELRSAPQSALESAVARVFDAHPALQERLTGLATRGDFGPRLAVSRARTADAAELIPPFGDRFDQWVRYAQFNGFSPRTKPQPDFSSAAGVIVATIAAVGETNTGRRVIFVLSAHRDSDGTWVPHQLRVMGDTKFMPVW